MFYTFTLEFRPKYIGRQDHLDATRAAKYVNRGRVNLNKSPCN